MARERIHNGLIALCLILVFAVSADRAHAIDASEHTLTTAFLYNFAKYTEWPEERMSGSSAFVMCFGAGAEIAPFMSRLTSRSLRDIPITVRAVHEADELHDCHLIYFERVTPLSQSVNFSDSQALLVGRNVPGVDISLFRKGENLRFQIRQERASSHGITFRSQLLKIAVKTE